MFRFILVLHGTMLKLVLDKLDFYLDINYHEEIYDIIQKVTALKKPIFSLMLPIIVRLKGIVTVFV